MLKLTAKELAVITDAAAAVTQIVEEMEKATATYLEAMDHLNYELDEAKEAARGVMENAANAADEYHDDKSEKWQESERGEAYGEWRDRLREISDAIAEPLELPEVSAPELPDWVGDLAEADFAEFIFDA